MIQLGTWLLRLLANRYVGGTMLAVGIGSQLPSAEDIKDVIDSTGDASKQWKGTIGATALLFSILLFATPIRRLLTTVVKKLQK